MIKKINQIILAMSLVSFNVYAAEFSAHINTACSTSQKVSVHSNDLDGDGDIDIIEASNHSIIWYEALDTGSLEKHMVGTAKNPTCVYSTDLDGDGDTDILCTISDKELGWYENDGGGSPSFSYRTIDASATHVNYLRASDMDKDGDMDVVTCQYGGARIIWYENKRNGSFASHSLFSGQSHGGKLIASDIDKDGHLDFVSCKTNALTDKCEVTWHRNSGKATPTLRSFTIIRENSEIKFFYCADLDQDDDMDVIAGLSTNEIIWYENNGSGFTRNSISKDTGLIVNLYPEDVNHDGALDIVCKLGQGQLTLLENTNEAEPQFVRKEMISETLFARSLN